MKKVLVVDDEKLIVKGIKFSLEQDEMEVDCAYDGEEALGLAKENQYDIILLDVMLPKLTGYEVCQAIREFSTVPIIMLTARNTEFDELNGFQHGADEYISKPFSPKILVTRVKSILKRAGLLQDSEFNMGNLKISYREHSVYVDDHRISLTPREYDLLCYLVANKNIVLNREQILQAVWGMDYEGDIRTVDTHIKCLRIKIPGAQEYIKTIRKIGYKFEAVE